MYLLEFGGEDDAFAAREAANAATGIRRLAPSLAVARGVVPGAVRGLAYTRRASDLLGHADASVEGARAVLEAASLDREGSVAVRATDVQGSTGVSTGEAERVLGQVLVDRGFSVDLENPDHVLRAAFSAGELKDGGEVLEAGDDEDRTTGEPVDACALGWLVVESVRDFGTRKPTDKPFFQPGSMDPLLARAVTNVAGAAPGQTVLDPMCGTGGVLVEAGLLGADVIGTDAQAKMVEGARTNLEHFLAPETPSPVGVSRGEFHVTRGDATHLPLETDAVDAVVFDAPYGRQSKIATHRLEDLVAGALAEARRVASRAVVVADRSWAAQARAAGWELESAFERRVHRSLTRYVLVLE
ncbi:methyltransferase domain-containing protein [Natrononativus amylolyticus]|uniref:methyltransferase domain-containing protein n=1 Tax=Natrononativus amylolyticus TaxID=2963434 RepID=UPI0020CDAEE7|nr:methyltransferase domain-containing protein [Natrononativus amylolyticus]